MESFVSDLEARMKAYLEELEPEKNAIWRYDRIVSWLRGAVADLKSMLQKTPFFALADEIRYFKNLAPKFYSQLFFYMKLHQVESFRAYASGERFREAVQDELRAVDKFFIQHNDICKYYYQNTSYWDHQLFTRAGRLEWAADDIGVILDDDFCLGSYWVSWIIANERYRRWLEVLLREVDGEDNTAGTSASKLPWKGTVTDLVELINGIYLAGSFGNVTLKHAMEWFQAHFDIDLGHYYGTWQEIARRKKSSTKYIDLIKEKLLAKIDSML